MRQSPEYEKALQRAMRLCARMERSSGQMRNYLQMFGNSSGRSVQAGEMLSQEEIESIMEELRRGQFIDDHRFAVAYIKDKRNFAKWGAYKIRQGLNSAGVVGEVMDDAFRELEDEGILNREENDLKELLASRCRSIAGGVAGKERLVASRLLRFALSRGYSYGAVMAELGELGLI